MFVCPWVEASESHSPPELRQQTERKQEPGTKRERERHKQRASETHTNTNLQSKLIYSKQNTIHLVSGDNTLIKNI